MLNILVSVSKIEVVFMKHKPTLHIHLNTLKPPVIFQLYLADTEGGAGWRRSIGEKGNICNTLGYRR